MKFNNIILPEIVEGRRGDKYWIDYYKTYLDDIRFTKEGVRVDLNLFQNIDQIQLNSFITIKKCRMEKYKIYHVGKGFLNVLSNLNKNVPVELLPKNFSAYINFAKNVLFDDTGPVQGAFVYIGTNKHMTTKADADTPIFNATYINKSFVTSSLNARIDKDSFNDILDSYTNDMIEYMYNDMVEYMYKDQIKEDKVTDENVKKIRNRIWLTIINTILYIYSENPKIERISPYQSIKKHVSKNEIKRKNSVLNECTMPITFVHRLYERKRIYTEHETWVESFPRWQRCGPEYKNVKLIWVKGHQRNYGG